MDEDKELDGLFDDEPADPDPNNQGDGKPKLPGAVKQAITKLREDRRQLREENERLKNDPRLKEPVNPPSNPQPPQGGQGESSDVAKLTFAQQHKDLDWEDVENAFTIAEMKKVSKDDALKDPLFVAYKEKKDQDKKIQQATPPPSGRSSVVLPEGKQMKDLSDAERAELQRKIIEKNRQK